MIESVTLATEIKTDNEPLFLAIKDKFSDCSYVSHETFKEKTEKAKAIIRTGGSFPLR